MDDIITSDVQSTTQQVVSFFSEENLKKVAFDMAQWSVSLVGKIIIAVLIWFIGKKLIKLCVKLTKKILVRGTLDVGVINFICSLVKFVLYALLIMIVIGKLGFETTSLLTLFGSAALAVGMSLQGSLSNFAGGLLLLIFKPFKIGDYIVSGTSEGTVESIELLYTRLHTIDNKVVMLPNGTLSNSNITNVGPGRERRLDIEMSIGYGADIKKAKAILHDILENTDAIIKDKEIRVIVKRLDESCVTLETRAWVLHEEYWDARFELLETYKERLDAANIEIPYNKLDVHIIQ